MLRPYHARDLDGVLAAWAAANVVAHPFLSDVFVEQVRHDIPNIYLPNAETFVWEVDGRIAGFIALLGNEVGAIFVDPQMQGQGIGRALMDHARELRGELELEVFKANSIGRRFYDRYGFELLRESVHEPTGQPLLRLRLAAPS